MPTRRTRAVIVCNSCAKEHCEELVGRLTQGQTAVWLMLECGDAAQDDAAAAALVDTELQWLEKELKLPELTEAPEDDLATNLPLTIVFSVLRVARSDDEAALVAMLLGSEADLKERNVPLVFPVFGRGRALLPMIGKGITAENTKDYAEFLVGACSCEVKEQNPGFSGQLSARVYLFREGIMAVAADDDDTVSDEQLREEIRITILHEYGHHHGLDEDDLEELGYG